MDEHLKIAVILLIAAILIAAIGSWAIAFTCGYLVATLVQSPGIDRQRIRQKLVTFWHSLTSSKTE
ncbi:MAG TPA: hypothetical protein PLE99_01915 [Candidatus Thiothrix moscowensis]|uniref:hypothetical protein n=1 Tax=unclassified Thiothrix TaxID=2636184 RepID=UPI001A2E2134|nr:MULTISPECIES: hypothetical protein [unclassified Thiothrix]MBJ6609561.1 hypothetical protein [Candidatus Thiothrix moscowensis]HRJ51495.1 hypothetical protein [Candidatus Thiothrix moscowensis]HRJ91450.1 hypothetical protein [Candidatus Thiothrix moscowensis]